MTKKILPLLLASVLLLTGCAQGSTSAQVAATTLPVYEFALRLCQGTNISVTRLVTESVSCLHDYTLQVSQIRAIESAQVVILSGAGLEDFLGDALSGANAVIDASSGIPLLCGEEGHDHDHEESGHHHETDPHIWLSPENAKKMASNICAGLSGQFPEYASIFQSNLESLITDLDALQAYGENALKDLSTRELITFHDGFSYFAQAFDLTIVKAVEEESGSEASAADLIELIGLVERHRLPAIFTETNGSTAAAKVIAAETGISVYALDMAMAADSYFEAMYHNIDTIREAYS